MLYQTFATDKKVEREGVWIEYPGNVRIRVARAGGSNRRYLRVQEEYQRKHKARIAAVGIPNEEFLPVLAEMYADTVILAWENVTDANGNVLEFNRDNVIRVLTDLPDLFRSIREVAEGFSVFREHVEQEQEKN